MNKFSQIPMRQILSALGIEIVDNGKTCRCPNPHHEDKNPSALINEDTVHCFTCNQTWNPIHIIQLVHDTDEEQAKDWYSQTLLGEPIGAWKSTQGSASHTSPTKTVVAPKIVKKEPEISRPDDYISQLEALMEHSRGNEEFTRQCKQYLQERGLDGTQELYLASNSTHTDWLKALNGRFLIPYRGHDGSILYLQGRKNEAREAKEGSSKYIYHKLFNQGTSLFGLETLSKQTKVLYVSEGAFTALAIRQVTSHVSIASIATPSKHHKVEAFVELLARFPSIKSVVFVPDNDEITHNNRSTTGKELYLKLAIELKNKVAKHIYLVHTEGSKDALDILKEQGAKTLKKLLKNKEEISTQRHVNANYQYHGHKKGSKFRKIESSTVLRQLFADALNGRDIDDEGHSLEELAKVLKMAKYNPLKGDYESYYATPTVNVNPADLATIQDHYFDDDGNILSGCDRGIWVENLKRVLFNIRYAAPQLTHIHEALNDIEMHQLLTYNPFANLESGFECEEEAEAYFEQNENPLSDIINNYIRFKHPDRAYKVLHVWLQLAWLITHKMLNPILVDKITTVNHLMPWAWGDMGSGKGLLWDILSYNDAYRGTLSNLLDSEKTLANNRGNLFTHLDDAKMKKVDAEALKKYLTMSGDRIRLAYRRDAEFIYRIDSVYASSNYSSAIVDETGDNRRIYPLEMLGGVDEQMAIEHGFKGISDFTSYFQVRVAKYYYNLTKYYKEQSSIASYYDSLKSQINTLMREAKEGNFFEENTLLPAHTQEIDDYFRAAEEYCMYADERINLKEGDPLRWTRENHIMTAIRKGKVDRQWVCKEELLEYLNMKKIAEGQVKMMALTHFKERLKHWGYDTVTSETRQWYRAMYSTRGSTVRVYELTAAKRIELIKKAAQAKLSGTLFEKIEAEDHEVELKPSTTSDFYNDDYPKSPQKPYKSGRYGTDREDSEFR